MANPQAENGHIDIAHEIAEALMRTNLSAYQSRILWTVLRQTYGWKKKEDWISNSQFVEKTGIARGHVARTVKELIMRNMVTRQGNKIAFNKDYTQWRELPRGVRVYQNATPSGNSSTHSGKDVAPSGMNVTPSGVYKRNYTKETPQKKSLQKKIVNSNGIPYQEIIEHINQKTSKSFSHKSKPTRSLIRARWSEGYRLDDFKTVIDNKCAKWSINPKMIDFLRPETLFGTKFESYLNDVVHPLQGKVSETTLRNINVLTDWRPPS